MQNYSVERKFKIQRFTSVSDIVWAWAWIPHKRTMLNMNYEFNCLELRHNIKQAIMRTNNAL